MKTLIPLLCLLLVGCQNSWYSNERNALKAEYEAGRLTPSEYYNAVANYDRLDMERNRGNAAMLQSWQQTQAQQEQLDIQSAQLREQKRANQARERNALFTPVNNNFESGRIKVRDQDGNSKTYQYEQYKY